jgi:hypothetical protein
MPRGGKRPGAGRKAPAGAMERTISVRLHGTDAEILDMLTDHYACSAGEAMRCGLRALHKATADRLAAARR